MSLQNSRGGVESDRRVAAATMDKLASAGLLNLVRSEKFGGYAYGPSALIRLGYELGQGCGSTAWCANITNVNSWFVSYWPEQAQQDVWKDQPDNRLAGLLAPTGKSERAEGGYKVWGRWPFGSNCDNSQWAFLSAGLPSEGDGPSATTWFLVPMSELKTDEDSWFVSGMQGTGSKTLSADEPIFVPEHRVIRFDDVATRAVPGCSIEGNTPANFSFSTFGACSLIGPILGMAKGALDWYVQMTKEKIRITMKAGLKLSAGQSPFAQERIGQASVMIESALAFALAEVEAAEQKVFSGEELTVSERIRVRAALVNAARQSVEAVNLFMVIAGASAADSNLPLQRFWRDINAAARHASLDTSGVSSLVGQDLLGLPPMGAF